MYRGGAGNHRHEGSHTMDATRSEAAAGTPTLEERERFWMTAVEQLMETGATALTDQSEFGRELDAAARGLRHRRRRLAEARPARHLRLIRGDLLLMIPALPPFL